MDTFMGGLQNALVIALTPAINNAIAGIPGAVNAAVNAAIPGAVNVAVNAAVAGIPGAAYVAVNAAVAPGGAINAAIPPAVTAAVDLALGPHIATLSLLSAELHSLLARNHNQQADQLDVAFQIRGIRKTVAGSGLATAMAVRPQIQGVALPPGTNNNIDTVCHLLMAATPTTIFSLNHMDILVLIEFYNEPMSIVAADGIEQRRFKVYAWLRY
ncbi:hypothetical protein B0H15DRAFT_307263 [Mycena belliarum]|uniref:Uncharacterized protein n=1 Tax=Mycena belliarum TaxID=1033014 RepID=A0AAD6U7H7_9AGAR|nr:hypothetical protein B0H15DRAFT_307263 [Mycena belliae]